MVSSQQIGGTAIFLDTVHNQEAAVPLLTSGGTKLLLPFDLGGAYALGIGLAQESEREYRRSGLLDDAYLEQGSTLPLTHHGREMGTSASRRYLP